MSGIIDLGCKVADVHHRYHEVHGALFGAASFRLVIDALRGRRRHAYSEFSRTLKTLHEELATLEAPIRGLAQETPAKGAERELRQVLLAYSQALGEAIAGLDVIFEQLEQDESGYRAAGASGRSGFTRDKLHYDQLLLELERLGTRLNRLFAGY